LLPLPMTMIAHIGQVLRAFALPLSLPQAREFLSHMRSVLAYLDLYRWYFPAEFALSMQDVEALRADLLPAPGQAYSLHEVRFLELIDRHLFPLPLDWLLDDIGEENRCWSIPVEPIGLNLSDESDLEALRRGWQLLYYLVGDYSRAAFAAFLESGDDAIFDLSIEAGKVDDELLALLCEQQREPLSFLRPAIDMMAHDTGTVWLDATDELPYGAIPWTVEMMDDLVEQYAEARAIERRADQFIDWLEANVTQHFTEVVALWNQCVQQTRQRKPAETTQS